MNNYLWKEEDIVCGRIVCKPCENKFVADGWKAKWTYKIGWHTGITAIPYKVNGKYQSDHYCFIAMTDGMTSSPKSKSDMVKWLNDNAMIPMPHTWFIKVMEYLKDCYNA